MNATGNIIASTTYGPSGKEAVRYKWMGGRVAHISRHVCDTPIKVGQSFKVGPFRLRIVDYCPWDNTVKAIRIRGISRLLYYFYRATPALEKVYRRLIITAAIWGCADYNSATVPDWRDLHMPWKNRDEN